MIRILLLSFLYFLAHQAIAQCPPDSLNMEALYHFDPPGMPAAGNVEYNDVWGYSNSSGQEFAIVGGADTIFIFDVSNPLVVTKVMAHAAPNTCLWRDFKTYGDYLYASADNCGEGLLIFDLSNLPTSVTFVAERTDLFTKAHNIYIDEVTGKLYAVGTQNESSGIKIIDLATDPANPSLLISIDLRDITGAPVESSYYVHDIFVRNDTAYCSHGYTGYVVWDCTNVNDIKWIGGFYDLPTSGQLSYVHSSWNTDNNDYAFVATEVGPERKLFVLDQSDFFDVTLEEVWKEPLLECDGITNNVPHNPYYLNGKLYVSYYQDGVQILDVSDPLTPTRIAYYDMTDNTGYNGTTGNWGVYPFLPSGLILATDTQEGFFVLQETQAPLPIELQDFIVSPGREEGTASVFWSFSSAFNVERFEIERRTEKGNFEKIKETPFLEDIYEYELNLPLAPGQNYFRLKTVDYDGSFEYFEVENIFYHQDDVYKIYPNPAENQLTISTDEESNYTIQIIDQSGAVIKRYDSAFTNEIQMNIADLPRGSYHVMITNHKQSFTSKLVIM